MNTKNSGKLEGYVIYVPAGDMRDAMRKLKEAGIIDIKEGKPRNPKDSIPFDIAPWSAIKKLIDQGFIDKNHNFILNPKKEEKYAKKVFCI